MLSIIGHHILWQPVFGVAFGVTSLQIVMCGLQSRHDLARPLLQVARKRFARLLVPWFLWCVIYGVLEVLQAWRWETPVLDRFDVGCLLAGTSFHLWFLPFAFVASLLANHALGVSTGLPRGLGIVFFTVLGAALVLAAPILQRELQPMRPLSYWIDGAATIPFGVAIGRVLSIREASRRDPWFLWILALGTLPMWIGPELVQVSPLYERYGVAISLACAGFLIRCRDSRLMAMLASYNLGVYLVHILVLRGMGRSDALLELPLAPRLALCYLLCLLVVHVMRRLRIPYLT